MLQVVGGRSCPRHLRGPVLGVGGVGGDHDLHDVELGSEALGELRRPLHGSFRRGGPIGPHHHARDAAPVVPGHVGRIIPDDAWREEP